MSQNNTASAIPVRVTWADYARVSALLGAFGLLLAYLSRLADQPAPLPEQILKPVFALVGLVACVWLLMVVVRNLASVRGQSRRSIT